MNPITEPIATTAPVRVPLSPDEPTTLVEVFELVASRFKRPDTLNYKSGESWVSISSDELLARAHRIAAGLHSLGVRRGDRVALLSESRPEWTLMDAGCIFLGAVDVPIYPTLTPSQVRYILRDSGARILVLADRQKYEQLTEVLKDCTDVEQLVFLEDSKGDAGITLSALEKLGAELERSQPELIEKMAHQTRPEDLATLIYTSGTTGEPKGVMLTHSNLVSNLLDSSTQMSFTASDTALSVLPLSHIFERQALYMYLYRGMAVYYCEAMDKIGPNLREVSPTILVGVPRIFEKIYARIKERAAAEGKLNVALLSWAVSLAKRYAQLMITKRQPSVWLRLQHKVASRLVFSRWKKAFGGRIRLLVSGGAALPEELGLLYLGAGIPIIQGYGLTETSPVITSCELTENRIGTVGRPIRNVEVRLAADGEIETRGPNVMRGYYHKPEATREVFTEDGWFRTGDIGTIDEEGFLRITDRKKELFKTSGGKYIAPQPIEQMIKGSRFVNQVVLIGNGRKFPAALIVPDWDLIQSYVELKGIKVQLRSELCQHPRIIDLFERQVAQHTRDLAQYEKVKKIALLENEFTIETGELTPTLKVKRRVIDEKYRNVIDRLYEDTAPPL
ncbi:MAG TPA: long-chain fatty acid--CoA ligase [Pyrinomonadaceae bacterium]|nr:long-chain fatty acid--CoA ligase [Pyrinomonadaceae bacterium]